MWLTRRERRYLLDSSRSPGRQHEHRLACSNQWALRSVALPARVIQAANQQLHDVRTPVTCTWFINSRRMMVALKPRPRAMNLMASCSRVCLFAHSSMKPLEPLQRHRLVGDSEFITQRYLQPDCNCNMCALFDGTSAARRSAEVTRPAAATVPQPLPRDHHHVHDVHRFHVQHKHYMLYLFVFRYAMLHR